MESSWRAGNEYLYTKKLTNALLNYAMQSGTFGTAAATTQAAARAAASGAEIGLTAWVGDVLQGGRVQGPEFQARNILK